MPTLFRLAVAVAATYSITLAAQEPDAKQIAHAGFTHVRTIDAWPPGDKRPTMHLTLFRK